jgi:glycosyltransferase involved in cell wall biosynthesis
LALLLSAYACEPHTGSEPAVGWHHATHLAQHHDVWCLTSDLHREAVEAELAVRPVEGLTMVYVSVRAGPRTYTGWRIQVHYYRWQLAAARQARRLARTVRFDVAHHVSYIRCWSPSALAVVGIPYVWGPVAGPEGSPPGLWGGLGPAGWVAEAARQLVLRLARFDPTVRLTARRSALAIGASRAAADWVGSVGAARTAVLSPTVAPDDALSRPPVAASDRTADVRFAIIGRLAPWKGHRVAIHALAASGSPGLVLDIIGAGPLQDRLEALASALGVADRVHFHDVDRAGMFRLLEGADVLLHPAVHNPGPTVLFEAMALRRPVLALDMGTEDVPVDVGIFLHPPRTHRQAVSDLAAAMRRLADDPAARRVMGEAGRLAVETSFNWTARARLLAELYRQVHAAADGHAPETRVTG